MLIGVLSDTHDRLPLTRAAVELLGRLGVKALIHCGDLTGPAVLDLLAGDVPAYFVFGNNDWDRDGLARYAAELGITCLGLSGVVELAGKRIGVAHGDRMQPLREMRSDTTLRYILTGHTHVSDDTQDGHLRWVNPGALHRTRQPSVATIDLAEDRVRFHLL